MSRCAACCLPGGQVPHGPLHTHTLSGQVARVGPEQSATDDHDAVTRPGIVAVLWLAPGSAPSTPSPGHGLAGAQAKAAVWGDRRRTACQAAHGGAREAASLLGASTEGRAWGDGAGTRARPGRGRARAAIAVLSAAAVAAACVVAGAAGGRAARLARGEHAVELLAHAATQKLAQAAKCDAACRTKAAAVKAQMIALRKEISQDYKRMTHFGDEAGYVPLRGRLSPR